MRDALGAIFVVVVAAGLFVVFIFPVLVIIGAAFLAMVD